MNTQNRHLEIKTKLAGSQTLEEELSLKEKTDPKLLGSFDKLCNFIGWSNMNGKTADKKLV